MKRPVGQPPKPDKVRVLISINQKNLEFIDLIAQREKRTRGDALDIILEKIQNLI